MKEKKNVNQVLRLIAKIFSIITMVTGFVFVLPFVFGLITLIYLNKLDRYEVHKDIPHIVLSFFVNLVVFGVVLADYLVKEDIPEKVIEEQVKKVDPANFRQSEFKFNGNYVVETHDLVKRYGRHTVINKVNMHVPEGAIYGFVGENGSGKTTIMRLISGLAEVTSGTYSLFGVPASSTKIYEVRTKMAAIVEATSLVPSMNARENLVYAELYQGVKHTDEERKELLKLVHLENVGKKKVRNFSLGMRQRLGIALALMNKPAFLMLDEPMNGLDPQGIAELRDLLIEINDKYKITILISSHILSELEKIASVYGFINKGRILQEITAKELSEKCTKSFVIRVDDNDKLIASLAKLKINNYKVYPTGEIKIYDEIDIGSFISSLHKDKIKVLFTQSNEESVEDYYLNLIKEAN